ncbi:hypothetical protein B296_00058378, partial [Ensete ventricosum]
SRQGLWLPLQLLEQGISGCARVEQRSRRDSEDRWGGAAGGSESVAVHRCREVTGR